MNDCKIEDTLTKLKSAEQSLGELLLEPSISSTTVNAINGMIDAIRVYESVLQGMKEDGSTPGDLISIAESFVDNVSLLKAD